MILLSTKLGTAAKRRGICLGISIKAASARLSTVLQHFLHTFAKTVGIHLVFSRRSLATFKVLTFL